MVEWIAQFTLGILIGIIIRVVAGLAGWRPWQKWFFLIASIYVVVALT